MTCSAYDDHGTGTMICNRCGYQWDKDDPDPPPCKTWDEIKKVKEYEKQRDSDRNREFGRQCYRKIKEDLNK